ncbi:MAG: Superfamily and helicase-like [Deltaproteobacteria bacterium]|nr:Superfamily and helicase-like [Deltaproteobacteria bacterium]
MALMIPSDIEQFNTPGEEIFYDFLKAYAKPDSRYIVWYTPEINDNEPDFILFSPDVGLIIFEVKDWAIDQIQEADAEHFSIKNGNRVEKRVNPYRQAKRYLNALMDKIKGDKRLVSTGPEHSGKPKVPLNRGVVFPNIYRGDFEERLGKIIEADKIFFEGDLSTYSPICEDTSGGEFTKAITRMFTPMFPVSLTHSDIEHLKQLIFPSVRIRLPFRGPSKDYQKHVDHIAMLDHQQEVLARQFDAGHRIISGPSGSGKTLVLIHKAVFLKNYNPAIKSILFVCFNITLAHYIKRLLAERHVPMGGGGVEVYHFFELCAKITGETIHHEKEESDYYDMVVQLTLEKIREIGLKYDAILIDEGQDFNEDMYKVMLELLNPATNSLTIAIDPSQIIYRNKGTGILKLGKVKNLTRVYRNTTEIREFVESFLMDGGKAKEPENHSGMLFSNSLLESHGPKPAMKKVKSLFEIVDHVSKKIQSLIVDEGFSFSEIAVLYVSKTLKINGQEMNLVEELTKALDIKGIMSEWASEDYRAKKSYDITTNSVTISTIYSAKGLDYACVLIIGLDFLAEEKMPPDQITNLTYVGLTRARYNLVIPYMNETSLIKKLLKAL